MKNTFTEKGNVLWFILIAIALLGTITMLLSRSGSSVDQTGDVEQRKIKASQIMRYTKSVEAAVQNLILSGCSENEISFENPFSVANYANGNSPTDESCHVFEPEGAGLQWASFISAKSAFSGHVSVFGVGDDNTRPDLLARIPVTSSLCTEMNKMLGVSTTASDITSDIVAWTPYVGSFTVTYELGDSATEAQGVTGKHSACILGNNGASPAFYHVLLPR